MWHEFPADEVRSDLRDIAGHGFDVVRVLLSWDAFLESYRQPAPYRLRDFESMLRIAHELGIQVVPVIGPQSLGDCVMLPRYAIDSAGRRAGVRVLCDGRLEKGGPRDVYTDPLMIEVLQMWVEALMVAFANHPAIAAWDVCHDPGRAMRPRRIADLHSTVARMTARIRSAGDPVWATLGERDVTSARGVRLGGVAEQVDRLLIDLEPSGWHWAPEQDRASASGFVLALAARLSSVAHLGAGVGMASDGEGAAHDAHAVLEAIAGAGGDVMLSTGWRQLGPRTDGEAPYDRGPTARRFGLVDVQSDPMPAARPWFDLARADRAAEPMRPWPAQIDEADYYVNLPDALAELYAQWRGGSSGPPANVG